MKRPVVWIYGVAILVALFMFGCSTKAEKMQAHIERGQAYFAEDKFRAAVIEYKNAIQINPEYVSAYLKLGATYLRLNDHRSAYQQYSMAVRLDPSNIDALMKLSILNYRSKRYDKSREQLDTILARQPDFLDAIYLKAGLYLAQDQFDESVTLYQKIIDIDPKQRAAYLGLAAGLMAQGRLDQAETALSQAADVGLKTSARDAEIADDVLAFKPRFMEVFVKFIDILLDRKAFAAALAKCDRQLVYSGHSAQTQSALYHTKGRIYLAQNKTESAETAFFKAIAADPAYQPSYHALEAIYLEGNVPESAIEMYRNALKKTPDQVELWVALGDLYDDLQSDPVLAEQQYRQALQVKPDYAPAANNLAFSLADREANLDEALKFAKIAASGDPENASIHDTLGWVYFKQMQYDLALRHFRRSLDQAPSAIVYHHLAMTYERKNQIADAIEAYKNALNLNAAYSEAGAIRSKIAILEGESAP